MLPLIAFVAATTFATASAIRLSQRSRRARAGKGGRKSADTTFEVVGHQVDSEESAILAVEEVPLDNRYGNKVFVSEHDFSRTAVVSLELESGKQLDSLSRFGFFPSLKLDLQSRLSRDLEVEIGSQMSRHVRVRFAAAPGERIRYRLTWKQNNQRGLFQVAVGRKVHTIPYVVTYGLSHSVESIAVVRDGDGNG